MKKYVIICVLFMLMFILGFFTGRFFIKTEDNNEIVTSKYITDIKNDKQADESINKILSNLEKLESRLSEIESEKIDIQGKITVLKNDLDNMTNFKYQTEIYSNSFNEIDELESNDIIDYDESQSEIETENSENIESLETQENQ